MAKTKSKVVKIDYLRDRVERLQKEEQMARDNREATLEKFIESVHNGDTSVENAWRHIIYADDALLMAGRRLADAENDVRDR